MQPLLRDGDFLLYTTGGAPHAGQLVVARHPDEPERWLVKRVRAVSADAVELGADVPDPHHEVGWVPRAHVVGRVVFRYWPPSRLGPL